MRRVDTLADAMLTCLERAVEELDTVTRTVKERVKREDGVDMTTDYTQTLAGEKGTVDPGRAEAAYRGAEGPEGCADAPL